MDNINLVAIPGSLRSESVHEKLVRSLQPLAPDGVDITIFTLHGIPLYNQDLEVDGSFPPAVERLRSAIAAADGLILATPEYNGSMSGVIKNGVDWASRGGLLAQKPVAPISGSPGALGATKGQEHLRSVLNHLGMYVMARPAVAIPQFNQKLNDDGIHDERTRAFVASWLEAFKTWIIQLNK